MPLAAAMRVIIADDQSTSRLMIRSGLEQIGIKQVEMAKDGEEALAMIMRKPAHLVISDFNMPGLDGVELLRAVRAHPPSAKSAFFLLTGSEDRKVFERAIELKVNNYLKKPVSILELKLKIESSFGPLA